MKFISVRDLRGRSAEIWRRLADEQELVITSNGKPIAILTPTDESSLERSLQELRRMRVVRAMTELQRRSVKQGKERLSGRKIDEEIALARRTRRR